MPLSLATQSLLRRDLSRRAVTELSSEVGPALIIAAFNHGSTLEPGDLNQTTRALVGNFAMNDEIGFDAEQGVALVDPGMYLVQVSGALARVTANPGVAADIGVGHLGVSLLLTGSWDSNLISRLDTPDNLYRGAASAEYLALYKEPGAIGARSARDSPAGSPQLARALLNIDLAITRLGGFSDFIYY